MAKCQLRFSVASRTLPTTPPERERPDRAVCAASRNSDATLAAAKLPKNGSVRPKASPRPPRWVEAEPVQATDSASNHQKHAVYDGHPRANRAGNGRNRCQDRQAGSTKFPKKTSQPAVAGFRRKRPSQRGPRPFGSLSTSMETTGLEPATSAVQGRRSPS